MARITSSWAFPGCTRIRIRRSSPTQPEHTDSTGTLRRAEAITALGLPTSCSGMRTISTRRRRRIPSPSPSIKSPPMCWTIGGSTFRSGGNNGVGLADFLLGDANNFNQAQTQDSVSISFNQIAAYVLDDWRVNNRLTLNLGLRWEAIPHAYDTNNRMSNFYPNLWVPANAAQFTSPTSGALNTSGPGLA